MSTCRYDRDAEDYLIDGEPCRTDEHGDPTHHCTARKTCPVHIGADELTCPRCIHRARVNLAWVRDLSALMPTEAIGAGVDSEAANLAAAGVDPRDWSERTRAMRLHLDAWMAAGRITEEQALAARLNMPDDDERHGYVLLTRWHMMIAEDYGHVLPRRMTVANSAAYLDRQLARIAHDPEQDFALLASNLRECRTHLESVIHNGHMPERGAPCPACVEEGVPPKRLTRRHGHWCDNESCERIHYHDDSGDEWVCPLNRDHRWDHETYTRWVEERDRYHRQTRRDATA